MDKEGMEFLIEMYRYLFLNPNHELPEPVRKKSTKEYIDAIRNDKICSKINKDEKTDNEREDIKQTISYLKQEIERSEKILI